jgi:reactive intermediate/imine deaminase
LCLDRIHADKDWNVLGETVAEKFNLAINNVKNVLTEAGLNLDDVVKVNLALTDLKDLPEINKVYGDYFNHPMPARAAIGVKELPLGATLEIEVVAAVRIENK